MDGQRDPAAAGAASATRAIPSMLDTATLLHDLQTVLAVSRAMGSERDLDRLLDIIVRAVTDLVDADRTSLFLVDRQRDELWTRIAQGVTEIRTPIGKGIAGLVAASGQTINIPVAYDDPRFNPESDNRSGYRTRSILCMPLNGLKGTVGVLQTLNKRDGRPFGSEDEWVLSALCSQAAVALDNAQLVAQDIERQRLARDMELAREIQLTLLPDRPPEIAGWRFAAWARSCDQTGGDYYDFVEVPGGVDVVVGDVTGHGIGAAMLMGTARAFLRALHEQEQPPERLVGRLNRLLERDMNDETFMSLALCRLGHGGSAVYVSAGHEPPLIYRAASGAFDGAGGTGLLLGLLDDTTYEAHEVPPLAAGDLLVLYTDGVTDAQAPPAFEQWGMERLRGTVAEFAARGAQAVADAIVERVTAFLGGTPPHDDITLVVAEKTAIAAEPALAAEALAPRRRLHIVASDVPWPEHPLIDRSWPSRLDLKGEIMDTVAGLLIGRGWVAEDDRVWLYLILDEAVVNAMIHGNEGDPHTPIRVVVDADERDWTVIIADRGEGFTPSQVPDPDDADNLLLEHGRGIRLMGEWLDGLTYFGNGSIIHMRRRRADRPSP